MEDAMNISIEWLGFAGIALSVLAYLPQIVHLIKEQCSAGLSLWAYSLWSMAALLLLAYAIARKDLVFISLQSYQAVATALVLYYCLRYRNQLCEDHGGQPLTVRLGHTEAEIER
jgi:uncharacterized protein with PQ loop repeat